MKFVFVPFAHVKAMCDVETGEVFVGSNLLSNDVEANIYHELAHIVSQDPDHTPNFNDQLDRFGCQPVIDETFSNLRKRLGIPAKIAANIGNISGIQNILTDYHLLQAYRRFSQKILGTEGHWDVVGEGDGDTTEQLIRLYPTPKGSFPVVVMYYPVVNHFRSTQAKLIANEMLVAEAKCMVGAARRKIAGIPMPDGGTLALDGEAMAAEGLEAKEKILEKAILLAEPLGISKW